jgi:hypothetical protein
VKITKRQLRKIIREAVFREYDGDLGGDDIIESVPERDELMDALRKKYGLNSRTTEEFGISPGGVWLNAESNVPSTTGGLPLFDYYMDMDPYEFGVHPEFEKFASQYGFAPEWNDPGTLMLWKL